jgi:hypothetical protein
MSLAHRIWSTKPYERMTVTTNNAGVLRGGEKLGNSVSLFTPALRKAFTENVSYSLIPMEMYVNVRLTGLAQNHVQ